MQTSTKLISILAGLFLVATSAAGCATLKKATGAPEVEDKELEPTDISSKLEEVEDKDLLAIESEDSEAKEGESMKASDGQKNMSGDDTESTEPSAVMYTTVGSEKEFKKYDKFFRKVAKMKGLVVLTRNFIQASEDVIQSDFIERLKDGSLLTKALGEGVDVPPKSRRQIGQLVMSGQFQSIPKKVEAISKGQLKKLEKTLFEEYSSLETVINVGPVVIDKLKPQKVKKQSMKIAELGKKLGKQAPQDFAGPQATIVPELAQKLTRSVKQVKNIGEQTPKLVKDIKSLVETTTKKFKGGDEKMNEDKSASM